MDSSPTTRSEDRPWLPPRWFVRSAWAFQRAQYRLTRGRYPLARPRPGKAGILRLRTTGRRSGQERAVLVAYWPDGDRYITLAMNGWGDPPPAWWLNLTAMPDAAVDTVDGPRPVRGRAAEGEERARLWAGFADYQGWGDGIDRYAALRSRETPVVVLEPR
ncbi:nitroreductase/quinone reductase family protein [Antribacter gilvus]|uniref:nitroreductase/quinone reductase family protein n=1 Tax=Antribacter gilvus TaxID=2304675 RepID=UPI000F79D156|nr:nitroreductase/quinone reductase family protein [Antribacter gilvus]